MVESPTQFIAASPGALQRLETQFLGQPAQKQGIFKDIWGTEFSTFMGFDASDTSEIEDNAQGRNRAFTADVSVYRCTDIRGAAIASVPLLCYDDPDPTKRNPVDHDALDVLSRTNPFGWVAGPQLMRYSLGSRDLHGAFAWNLVPDRGGRLRGPLPREIYWMPPGQYKPVAGKDLSPPQPKLPFAGLMVRQNGKEILIPAQNVVYAPTFHPTGDLRGQSKITAFRTQLNLRLYGQMSNLWFFRNNQRPDVVVTGAMSPTIENVNLLRRIWKAAFGGDQARGPAFLPQDMKVQLLTMAAKDAEWLGQQHAAREDILAAFGVPPPVYGDLARATYENIRTAYQNFWQSALIPELDEIAWFLTQQFLWKWPDAQRNKLYFAFDYTKIEALQEDANAIWERTWSLMDRLLRSVEMRALLPNQFRQIVQVLFKQAGLPDTPWSGSVPMGHMHFVKVQEIPVTEASAQLNVDIQAARAGNTDGQTHKAPEGGGSWVMPDPPLPPPPPVVGPPSPAPPLTGPRPTNPSLPGPRPKPGPNRNLPPVQGPPAPAMAPQRQPGQTRELLPGQDLIIRRLKRHFREEQTAAERALRTGPGARKEAGAGPEPLGLWDSHAGRLRARAILLEGLEMAGLVLEVAELEARANAIEGEMLLAVEAALRAPDPRGAIREVFREAIEERAAAIAAEIYEEIA